MKAASSSSRLYATTMKPPPTTKAAIHGLMVNVPTIPIAIAPAIETTASTTSTRSGIRVFSGRPLSSSSACAPIPTARKNAASVHSRRSHANAGVSAAPIAT